MLVLEALLPTVLVLGLGYGLARGGFHGREFILGLNRLTYYVGLPALILAGLTTRPVDWGQAGVLGWLMVATAGVAGAAYLLRAPLRVPRAQQGAFVQASFRGNHAYLSVPVVTAATAGAPDAAQLANLALLMLGPTIIVYNVLGYLAIRIGAEAPRVGGAGVVRKLALNPLILSSALGAVMGAARLRFPGPLETTLVTTGRMAVPVALLCVGGILALVHLRAGATAAAIAGLLKSGFTPALGLGLGHLAGLERGPLFVLLVFCASPAAVASFTMAAQEGGDEGVASQAIVASTVLSLPVLAGLVWWWGGGGV